MQFRYLVDSAVLLAFCFLRLKTKKNRREKAMKGGGDSWAFGAKRRTVAKIPRGETAFFSNS